MAADPLRIAIIGSGISGLSASWLLARHPSRFAPVLFEAAASVGGHTNSASIDSLDGSASIAVDTGFIVCNNVTYPNFLELLACIGVDLVQSDMSFSVSRNAGEFEWAGQNLQSLFAQPSNILPWTQPDGGIYRLVWDTLRFHAHARRLAAEADALVFDESGRLRDGANASDLADHPLAKQTLGAFFSEHGYSRFFYENYVLPMTASIWSTPADMTFDKFPVLTLVRFMRNHLMLQIGNRPKWRTVDGASQTYAQKIVSLLPDVRVGIKIVGIERPKDPNAVGPVTLVDANGRREIFDHVIFATHTDQALAILGELATPAERRILGAIKYSKNRAVLHRDPLLMPKRRAAWASWNYLTTSRTESKSNTMCLTYWMNQLQPFVKESDFGNVFVTMNPLFEPKDETVLGEWMYEHPVYTPETISAQESLNEIQNKHSTTFCGAWTNYGFHEDGCTSGLLAAMSLGADCPFPVHLNGGYPTARLPPPPPAYLSDRGIKRYQPPPPLRVAHLTDTDPSIKSTKTDIFHIAAMGSVFVVCLLAMYYSGAFVGAI